MYVQNTQNKFLTWIFINDQLDTEPSGGFLWPETFPQQPRSHGSRSRNSFYHWSVALCGPLL